MKRRNWVAPFWVAVLVAWYLFRPSPAVRPYQR